MLGALTVQPANLRSCDPEKLKNHWADLHINNRHLRRETFCRRRRTSSLYKTVPLCKLPETLLSFSVERWERQLLCGLQPWKTKRNMIYGLHREIQKIFVCCVELNDCSQQVSYVLDKSCVKVKCKRCQPPVRGVWHRKKKIFTSCQGSSECPGPPWCGRCRRGESLQKCFQHFCAPLPRESEAHHLNTRRRMRKKIYYFQVNHVKASIHLEIVSNYDCLPEKQMEIGQSMQIK